MKPVSAPLIERKKLLKMGIFCYNEGRHETALECFRRAAALGEKSARAKCFMAHAMDSMGNGRRAISIFTRVLRQSPAYLPGYTGLAGVLRRLGRLGESSRVLKKALEIKPRHKEVRRQLAENLRCQSFVYEGAGKFSLAERSLRRSAELDPGEGFASLRLSEILLQKGRRAQAESFLKSATAAAPLENRFKILMRLRRYSKAFEVGERILDSGATVTDLRTFWNPWGWDPRQAEKLRGLELKSLDRLPARRRENPWFHYYRGSLRGGFESQADFEPIANFPRRRYGWMYMKVGWSSLRLGLFSRAIKELRIALRQNLHDWTAHGYLGEAYLCLGRNGAAFEELRRALTAAPVEEKGQVMAWQGAFELWLGKYEKALRHLEAACDMGAQHAFCWKGAALLKLGHAARALVFLEKTLRLYPQDVETLVWRAEAERKLGRHEKVIEDLSRSTGLWALFNRALSRNALKDFEGMKADFDAIPGSVVGYVGGKAGIGLGRALSVKEMRNILEKGLELARGYRRDDYGQAVWMRG